MFCSYTVCYFRYIVTESTVAEKNRAPILRLLRSAIVSDFFKKEKKIGRPGGGRTLALFVYSSFRELRPDGVCLHINTTEQPSSLCYDGIDVFCAHDYGVRASERREGPM